MPVNLFQMWWPSNSNWDHIDLFIYTNVFQRNIHTSFIPIYSFLFSFSCRDFAKIDLPAIAKIVKGQHQNLGVPTLSNPSLQSTALFLNAGKKYQILAQPIKIKEGRKPTNVGKYRCHVRIVTVLSLWPTNWNSIWQIKGHFSVEIKNGGNYGLIRMRRGGAPNGINCGILLVHSGLWLSCYYSVSK